MAELDPLVAVTPIDGRYADKVDELRPIVSEYGLIRYRVATEVAWLRTLGSGVLPDVEPLSGDAHDYLQGIADNFTVEDARNVKEVEKTTNHDVKAVENYLRVRMALLGESFDIYSELIHFGCTSEDINNLAYAMMLRDLREDVLAPNLTRISDQLEAKRMPNADVPMLARTHGQPATPTTLGKEMAVFSERIVGSRDRLGAVAILGKFNGASGNYNAASFAYPEVDWPAVSRQFVESLGFTFNPVTTQIEPHDWMAAYFNEVALQTPS